MQTIVIGHKNPDMDSICAAVGYARLKQLQGVSDVIPARAGNTNERIDFVLQKFGVTSPEFISDVSPRVKDVMVRPVISVHEDTPVYDAIHLIEEKRLRGLPVIDDNNKCLGLLSSFKISRHLFPPREEAVSARKVAASLHGLVETFGGSLIVGSLSRDEKKRLLMVGAMNEDSFTKRLQKYDAEELVLFVGDRPDIQWRAIEARVGALVLTGGLGALDEVLDEAKRAGVTVISSPHDTATSVMLARGAVKVSQMLESDYISFHPEDSLDDVQRKASKLDAFVFPIIEKDGTLAGILSKSDFLKTAQRQLVLVDHNELSQAVAGADRVPIIEILDHHRLGGFASSKPIHFWNNPVGSTSTIVALCYHQAGIPIPCDIAGLLMAGMISDTLNLQSPTSTMTDRNILKELAGITGISGTQLAEEIFSIGSPLLTLATEHVITADCKEYSENGYRFTVSQIEELSFSNFEKKREELMEGLENYCRQHHYFFSALLVTDINTQTSMLLCSGAEVFLRKIDFPLAGTNLWELAGIVSRKKQLLPYLVDRLNELGK